MSVHPPSVVVSAPHERRAAIGQRTEETPCKNTRVQLKAQLS